MERESKRIPGPMLQLAAAGNVNPNAFLIPCCSYRLQGT